MRARIHGSGFAIWLAACGGAAPESVNQLSASTPGSVTSVAGSASPANPAAGTRAVAGSPAGVSPTRSAPSGAAAADRAGSGPVTQAGTAAPAAAAGSSAAAGTAAAAAGGGAGGHAGTAAHAGAGGRPPAAGGGGAPPGSGPSPLYRVPLRVHVQQSKLTDAELGPIFEELNTIWQRQAGICFEIEVVTSDDNRTDGFDFRYTSGRIPGAENANGLTQSAHAIWSIDHPQLNAAPHPVMYPTARTTAHELGHALGLAHENPPPSNDCASPCYCAERGDDCDDYLLRSGTKGFFLSPPEIEIARQRAGRAGRADPAAGSCSAARFMR